MSFIGVEKDIDTRIRYVMVFNPNFSFFMKSLVYSTFGYKFSNSLHPDPD
jgi:hypothetical protein